MLNYINPERRELDHVFGSGLLNYTNPKNRESDNVSGSGLLFAQQFSNSRNIGWIAMCYDLVGAEMRSSADGDLVSQFPNHRNPEISEIAHGSVLG